MVSAQVSVNDLKPAPARSRVDRASRSSRVKRPPKSLPKCHSYAVLQWTGFLGLLVKRVDERKRLEGGSKHLGRCQCLANDRLWQLETTFAGLVEHFPTRIDLFLIRRFRLLSGSYAVEKLPDQTKRINLIVVFAGGEAQ